MQKDIARKLDLDQQNIQNLKGTQTYQSNEIKDSSFQNKEQFRSNLENVGGRDLYGQQRLGELETGANLQLGQSDLSGQKFSNEQRFRDDFADLKNFDQQFLGQATDIKHHAYHAQNAPIIRQAPEVKTEDLKMPCFHKGEHLKSAHLQQQKASTEAGISSTLTAAKESIIHGFEKMKETIMGEHHDEKLQAKQSTAIPNANFSLHRDTREETLNQQRRNI